MLRATLGLQTPATHMRDSLADAGEFDLAEWRVTPSACLLRRGPIDRPVPPRLMRLLLVLASRPRHIVSKQEIVERVWDNEDVSDDSLSSCVYQLRKALGDESRRPRYIETITKRGYRLLVDAALPPSPRADDAGGPLTLRASQRDFPAQAVDAYERGRALLGCQRARNLLQAKLYFEHALAREPRFAAAHAGLASIQVALHYNQPSGGRWADHARFNARAALELDPQLAEAHAAQGLVLGLIDADFPAADAEYRIAFELRPDLVLARRSYALLLAVMQRSEDALHQLAEAARHDPLNVSAQTQNAHIFFLLRRFDRAAEELLKVLAHDPRSWSAYAQLAFIHWLRGDGSEVHATYRAAASACDTQDLVIRIDAAFATGGAPALYAEVARHLEGRDSNHRFQLPELIGAYTAAGDHERALHLLERGCTDGRPPVLWLLRSPYIEPLRTEAAFHSLVARYCQGSDDSSVAEPSRSEDANLLSNSPHGGARIP